MRATLKFLASGATGGVYHASTPGPDAHLGLDGEFEEHAVPIENGWQAPDPFHLDVHGFTVCRAATKVESFYDDDALARTYDAEAETTARHLTGADRAVVFDHTRRGDSRDLRAGKKVREPSTVVHCDYTPRSARWRLHAVMGAEARALEEKRFAIINLWRPIAHAASTSILALADARGNDPADLVPAERRSKDRVGEIYLARYNEKQRWLCFPDLNPDHVLAIKTYDAAEDGRARLAMHTAFSPPAPPEGAAPRESIETRVFCFF